MAHRVGPTKTAVFILQAAGRSLPEITKHLGIALSTAHRGGLEAGKVLRSAVMREKGRMRHRGIDVADASRVVPSDSEWAEVLGEIGKVVNARGPLRDGQREGLRRLVEDILSSA